MPERRTRNMAAELEAGTPVLIVRCSHLKEICEPATVVKVGRALYWVLPDRYAELAPDSGAIQKFSIETRRAVSAGGSAGYGVWLRTPAEMAERDRLIRLREELRAHGLEFRPGYGGDWTTQALEELTELVARVAPRVRA